jgi:MFS family permease
MYGLTRAALTLIGVAAAGALLWLATTILPSAIEDADVGEYWAAFGFVALAGLGIALSQLLGGWTKWGWPRISANVFLLGFLPALVVGGWILAAHEPESSWLGDHVRGWSNDLGVDGLVDSMGLMIPAVAFGIGLVFGLTFDTTGPRVARTEAVPAAGAQRPVTADGNGDGDDRRVRLDDTEREPQPVSRSRDGEE